MAFDARAATNAASETYPPFDFIGLDGETYYIQSIALVGTEVLGEIATIFDSATGDESEDEAVDALTKAIETLAKCAVDEDSADAVRALSPLVVGQLLKAWKDATPDLGKSAPPSSSTKKQGRPSKSTRKRPATKPKRSKSGK